MEGQNKLSDISSLMSMTNKLGCSVLITLSAFFINLIYFEKSMEYPLALPSNID
jgi:hypothetical protein